MPVIEADSLSKTYQAGLIRRTKVDALASFSIAVEAGEIFSLLGPNGAGKTTFVKIILSLTLPTSGGATILGQKLPNDEVKGRIGYLPESHRYPGYFTGEQILRLFGQLSGVDGSTLDARIPVLLDLVGMGQWRKTKVKKYSKGMMQRLGLAQALVNDPDILFLDEPTDGVDPVGRKDIRELLRDLKLKGKTIFLNSHLLSEVELISDRVAILDKGKLLKVGTVDELTRSGSRYVIGINGTIPQAWETEARALVMDVQVAEESVSIGCNSPAELNAAIDLLRKHGVQIVSVGQQRNTLEESFLSLIKRESAS
jgi:ABC-2 type transport system ATP-binding protein